ncbi:Uncharacterized protein Fot_55685 [Forsythia ovata]|uniref:Uncharacterized protein n=1 Tax=Forsythia ovata TaxID=205694 RepID=A0ABD1P3I7_9LAMI
MYYQNKVVEILNQLYSIVVTNDGNAIPRELDIAHPTAKDLAIDATTIVGVDLGQGLREVDVKKYITVEKIPGGQLEDSKVLKGVMFNKDVVAPGKMKRKILNPRIILLDCSLKYKK